MFGIPKPWIAGWFGLWAIVLSVFLALYGSGCVPGTHQDLAYSLGAFAEVYRPTMLLDVNGKKGVGYVVVPSAANYRIKTQTENDIQFERLTSCHRAIESEDVGDAKEYLYRPALGIEDRGSCGITIEGFSKNLQHEWGLVVFEDSIANIPATVTCSGDVVQSGGTSVCVALAGLKEQIVFSEDVTPIQSNRPGCSTVFQKNGTTHRFNVSAGMCAYYFRGKSGYHRLWTMGYQRRVRTKE